MLDVTARHNHQIATAGRTGEKRRHFCRRSTRNLVLDLDGAAADRPGRSVPEADGPLTIVMGPNGAGKSLLLRLLHGMIAPTSAARSHGAGGRSTRAFGGARRWCSSARSCCAARLPPISNLCSACAALPPQHAERADILDHVGLGDRARPAGPAAFRRRAAAACARPRAGARAASAVSRRADREPRPGLGLPDRGNRATAAQDRGTKMVFVTHDIGQARRLGDEIVFMHRGRVLPNTHPRPASSRHQPRTRRSDYLGGRLIL